MPGCRGLSVGQSLTVYIGSVTATVLTQIIDEMSVRLSSTSSLYCIVNVCLFICVFMRFAYPEAGQLEHFFVKSLLLLLLL